MGLKRLLFKEKIMFYTQLIKPNNRPGQNRVDTYGAPVFAPDYSITVLVAEMCTNHLEHSI